MKGKEIMERKVNIIEEVEGHKVVLINDIRFKSRRVIDWEYVESLLKEYIGDFYEIAETAEKIYI